jgi:DNA-directed RNA polymerase subunit RPC12/RpoP
MVVYDDVLTFLQTMAFVCSTCGKAYSANQNLARHSETHQDPKACHCGGTESDLLQVYDIMDIQVQRGMCSKSMISWIYRYRE